MKKIISVLLTMLMAVSLFAACDRPLNREVNDGREMLSSTATAEKKKVTTVTEPTTTTTTKAEKKVVAAPTEKQLLDGFFKVVAGIERGTAGASLKEAEAAVAVFKFAQDYSIASCDIEELRDNMLDVWEDSMTAEQRSDFDASWMGIVQLLDGIQAKGKTPAAFADAGVAEEFDSLKAQKGAWDNWDTLRSHTMTMGNSDGE